MANGQNVPQQNPGQHGQGRRGQQWTPHWFGPDFRLRLEVPESADPGEEITAEAVVTARQGRYPAEAGRVFLKLNGAEVAAVLPDTYGSVSAPITILGDKRTNSVLAYLEHMPEVREQRQVTLRTDREVADLRRKLEIERLKREDELAVEKARAELKRAKIEARVKGLESAANLAIEKRRSKELTPPVPHLVNAQRRGGTYVVIVQRTRDGKPEAGWVSTTDDIIKSVETDANGLATLSFDVRVESRQVTVFLAENPAARILVEVPAAGEQDPAVLRSKAEAIKNFMESAEVEIKRLEKARALETARETSRVLAEPAQPSLQIVSEAWHAGHLVLTLRRVRKDDPEAGAIYCCDPTPRSISTNADGVAVVKLVPREQRRITTFLIPGVSMVHLEKEVPSRLEVEKEAAITAEREAVAKEAAVARTRIDRYTAALEFAQSQNAYFRFMQERVKSPALAVRVAGTRGHQTLMVFVTAGDTNLPVQDYTGVVFDGGKVLPFKTNSSGVATHKANFTEEKRRIEVRIGNEPQQIWRRTLYGPTYPH